MTTQLTEQEIDQRACGCYACDEGRQPGHFQCEACDPEMLLLEQQGKVYRALDSNGWHWHVVNP